MQEFVPIRITNVAMRALKTWWVSRLRSSGQAFQNIFLYQSSDQGVLNFRVHDRRRQACRFNIRDQLHKQDLVGGRPKTKQWGVRAAYEGPEKSFNHFEQGSSKLQVMPLTLLLELVLTVGWHWLSGNGLRRLLVSLQGGCNTRKL